MSPPADAGQPDPHIDGSGVPADRPAAAEHEHANTHRHDHTFPRARGADDGHGVHASHDHGGWRGLACRLAGRHSHDPSDSIDDALLANRAGTHALGVSLAGLLLTGALQAAVAALSGSVGLLADTIHNVADALTALPLGIAFLLARRAPSYSYTYGYARAEDLAGLGVVALIAASAVAAAVAAVGDLAHPRVVHHLLLVGIAGGIGCLGNEAVAHYRIRVGRRIGSAALVADGLHARTDGMTSLAVVLGAGLAAAGWRVADPIVGLAITVAIVLVLRNAAREVLRRLMDAVDPELVERVRATAGVVPGVESIGALKLRWTGHELLAEIDITVRGDLTVDRAHEIAEEVRHRLLHALARLSGATIHVNPSVDGDADPHAATAHHFPAGDDRDRQPQSEQPPDG